MRTVVVGCSLQWSCVRRRCVRSVTVNAALRRPGLVVAPSRSRIQSSPFANPRSSPRVLALAVARPCLASCRSRNQRAVVPQILGLRLAHRPPLSLDAPRRAPFVRHRRILVSVAPYSDSRTRSLPSAIAPRVICALCSVRDEFFIYLVRPS